ncbi:MAG TPA: DinB family protein [Bryobacteraceae bacterium]
MTVEKIHTLSTLLIMQWKQACDKLVALAEHVPEDKYEYRPVDEVRTFADVLRHTAFWNQYVAERANGRESEESLNELPKARYSTKKQILDALRRSNKESVAALQKHETLNDKTAEMVVTFIAHTSEHYGQLVVYARLNNIVPPSSAT